MMDESVFLEKFAEIAKTIFDGNKYRIEIRQNLFYELAVNEKMKLAVRDINQPQRGSSAFQTDICILEIRTGTIIPRVVIEFKTNPSTHDILIYSAKAGKHKKIYPWLRYGMLADKINTVPNRFFKHNEHMDFFIAAEKYIRDNELGIFIKKLVEDELLASNILEEIYFDKKKLDLFRTRIEFKNLID